MAADHLSATFAAIADPTRRAILLMVAFYARAVGTEKLTG